MTCEIAGDRGFVDTFRGGKLAQRHAAETAGGDPAAPCRNRILGDLRPTAHRLLLRDP